MGIEYIALTPLSVSNHRVTAADQRCVRFWCEKPRHTSQLQPWHRFCYCAFYRLLGHISAHQMVLLFMHQSEDQMRTTVTLDDDLLAKAIKLTGGLDRSTVLREGLKALIERESALRLAKLGGTQPQLEAVPRRRSSGSR
jgi:Arc/MetJ family transcription regulator